MKNQFRLAARLPARPFRKETGTVLDNLTLVNEAGQGELVKAKSKSAAGFDLIVGNPPFVTARNPVKRELYR